LVAVEKVFVNPGQSVTVSLNTRAYASSCAFCVVADDGSTSVPAGTAYNVSVGDGATDYFSPAAIVAV
jgi:hypothetical protein